MAKPKVIDHMGQIEQALEKVHTAHDALEATRNAIRPLADNLALAGIRLDAMAKAGREHLEYWGRAQGGQDHPWTKLFGENTSTAEAVFAALHEAELAEVINRAIEANHQRYVDAGGLVIATSDLPAALAKAEQRFFDAECALEAKYEAAEKAGIIVDRFQGLSPEAVLGLARGESVAFDFHSEKMEAIVAARDGAHAAMSAARDRLNEAQEFLVKISASNDPNYKPAEEDREAAQKRIDRCKQTLAARSEELHGKIRLAGALEDYVRDHILPKPSKPFHNPHKRPEPVAEQPKPENWQDRFDADEESEIEAE